MARLPGASANHARFTFLDDRAHDFWIDWERAADDAVAQLRTEAGRDPYDRALTDQTGVKHVHHPLVGDLHLDYEAMELPAQPGLTLIAFTAPAGSPDEDAIHLLSSWAATHDPASDAGSATRRV